MGQKEKAPLKNFGGQECSDEFYSAFCHSGSVRILCEACGRVHYYYVKDGCYEDGEFEELEENRQADPERYCERDTDSIRWANIFGKQVVFDCPCGYAAYIEKLIWSYRRPISEYLAERAQKELNAAQQDADVAQKAHEAVQNS